MADWLKQLAHAVEGIPFAGTVGALPEAAIQGITGHPEEGKQALLRAIPGFGTYEAYKDVSAGSKPSGDPADQQAAALLKGLTYGQEEDPNAQLITQLSGLVSGLKPAQAQALLKSVPAGSTLAANLSQALAGEPVDQIIAADKAATAGPSSASPYGFDPLSIGQAFSTVIAPWLQQQQAQSTAGINSEAKAMQDALSGASPQLQQAYAAAIPSMQGAENTLNQAATQSAVTAPQADALIQALTNVMNQAKLTQAAAQAEPYSATFTTGSLPSGSAGSPVANANNLSAALAQNVSKSIGGG